jgi:4-diphosphocytidyl-2-C-methyl-D-erythritol kinase
LIVFPNAKINLGLHVLDRRPDGYHNLETVFYPIQWNDALEVVRARNNLTSFDLTGIQIAGNENSCVKAFELLRKDHDLPDISICLHKTIPVGAGLGGGSADGAFMLKLLNEKFNLQLPDDKLEWYALQLGSDCPFFIRDQPAFATGRGEKLSLIDLDLSNFDMLIVFPGIHVSTAEAFSRLQYIDHPSSVTEIIKLPVHQWKEKLVNDFEQSVFEQYPEISKLKETLYAAGAVYASMSGSGSAVYGLFEKGISIPTFPESYQYCFLPGSSQQ